MGTYEWKQQTFHLPNIFSVLPRQLSQAMLGATLRCFNVPETMLPYAVTLCCFFLLVLDVVFPFQIRRWKFAAECLSYDQRPRKKLKGSIPKKEDFATLTEWAEAVAEFAAKNVTSFFSIHFFIFHFIFRKLHSKSNCFFFAFHPFWSFWLSIHSAFCPLFPLLFIVFAI